ncbi:NIL domain protein [Methanothermus fervidus DSM 2088]|uniref:NIL domain protein n=1 Tax=Methanothermus fervidus (strain ATCC 43054 / DSM 2088 / JCM 10308 / V24 S) TaxID=523846 RepID=E3GX50_METFV|nr:4Fe-4S binding protein [Methanothermus fervidus]ADP78045.1 NIL domain protein [Methanothermus fervidus DSM 2088]
MRVWLYFSKEIIKKPVISDAIKKYDIDFNILHAHITSSGGKILAEILGKRKKESIEYLKNRGIIVEIAKDVVRKDKEKCIDCGACVSICPVGAISIKDDWTVEIDDEKCVGCGCCVITCPMKAVNYYHKIFGTF